MNEPRRHKRQWTQQEIDTLIKLSNEKKPIDVIARELGRSYAGVMSKRHLYKDDIDPKCLKTRIPSYITDEDKDEVIRLYVEEKRTMSYIQDYLGVSLRSIRKHLTDNGVEVTKRQMRKILDRDELQALASSGEYSLHALQVHFETSFGTLMKNIEYHKIDVSNVKTASRDPWTTKQVEELARLVKQGQDFWRIGLAMNRTATSVRTKAYSLGLTERHYDAGGKETTKQNGVKLRFWTKDEEYELERLYASGMFIAEIAEKMDRPYYSIQKKAHYMNLYEKYAEGREVVYREALEKIAKEGFE